MLEEIKGSEDARKTQEVIWWTSTSYYNLLASNNLLINYTVNIDDIKRSEITFWQLTPFIDGTIVRKVTLRNIVEIFPFLFTIAQLHKKIIIYIDFLLWKFILSFILKLESLISSLRQYVQQEENHR